MSKVRGQGGYWLRQINVPPTGYVGLVVHNALYEVLTSVEIRGTRSAGCGGWEEGLTRFKRVDHALLRVAEDDTFYPQALGFTEGQEITVYLKRGYLNQFDLLEKTVVQSVRRTVDQHKAIWVEVICVKGRYLRAQSPPGLAPESQPAPDAAAEPHPRTPDPSEDEFAGGGGDF